MVERSVYLLRGAAPGIDRRSAKFTIQNGRLPEQPTMKKTQQKKKISFRLERPFISQTGIDRTPTSSRSSISLVIFSQILAKRLFLHILANPGGQKPNGPRETAVTDFGNALRRNGRGSLHAFFYCISHMRWWKPRRRPLSFLFPVRPL